MAFAGLVMGTGGCVAGYFRRLAGDIVRVAGPVILPLTEAVTAGLVRYLCVAAAHMDVVFAAAVILIIGTIYD